MSTIVFSEPTIYKDKANKKWCVRYKKVVDGVTSYPKEYGKSYNIRLNSISNLKERQDQLDILLELVKDDLKAGIQPEEKERVEEELRIKEIEEASAFSFDEVLKFVYHKKNYNTPLPNQKHSIQNLSNLWKNDFKPFLTEIGKVKDIRKVTIDDIEKFIEIKTTPRPQFKKGGKPKIDSKTGKQVIAPDWSYNTATNRINWLAIFFQPLVDARKLAVNPCHNIKRQLPMINDITGSKLVRFQIFTKEELNILWEYLEKESYSNFTFGKTLYYTYIRPSEMLRLRLWMIDLKQDKIVIPPSIAKNGKSVQKAMEVFIPPPLKPILEKYIKLTYGKDLNPDYLLFPAIKNWTKKVLPTVEMEITKISRIFVDHFAALRKIHPNLFPPSKKPYSLKHSGNTYFIENNYNTKNKTALQILTFLRKQNRHATLSQTQTYISEDLGIMLDAEDNAFNFS